jgi:hypothetical protein
MPSPRKRSSCTSREAWSTASSPRRRRGRSSRSRCSVTSCRSTSATSLTEVSPRCASVFGGVYIEAQVTAFRCDGRKIAVHGRRLKQAATSDRCTPMPRKLYQARKCFSNGIDGDSCVRAYCAEHPDDFRLVSTYSVGMGTPKSILRI